MARTPDEPGCLFPSCPYRGKRRVRGLCINHYQASLRLVTLGHTTWEQLEGRGRALPARPRAVRNPGGRRFVQWALGGEAQEPERKKRKARQKRGRT